VASNRWVRVGLRTAWGTLSVSHAYWLAGTALSPTGSTSSAVLLALSLVFFLLKVLDVRCLRVPWNRRSILGALLVVVLLHARVVDRLMFEGTPVEWLALPIPMATSVVLRLVVIACVVLLAGVLFGCHGPSAVRRTWRYVLFVLGACSSRKRVFALACGPPRGPPTF
jgi:hypothetical protein